MIWCPKCNFNLEAVSWIRDDRSSFAEYECNNCQLKLSLKVEKMEGYRETKNQEETEL